MKSLGIPFSALVSVIFGLMILSFPLGAYVVFNSNIEDGVRFDFPINGFDLFPAGIGFEIPIQFELGDVFIGLWCVFVILFSIAMFGPKTNFLKAMSSIMSEGKYESKSNYLVSVIKWFAILIVVFGIFFGVAHIISGEPWSLGKFAQATASGIIIGWVYFKHGFVSAILVHWSTNYFIFSYVNFLAEINEITVKNAFSHSLTNSLEILFVMTGILSIVLIIVNYLNLKKEKKLEI